MIIGAHTILYSKKADKDRKFLKDVLGFKSVDAGEGWLIFALPPGEVAVHPTEDEEYHEFYLMCDDIKKTSAQLEKKKVKMTPVRDYGWGLMTMITLPGGGTLGLYEPRHKTAIKAKKRTPVKSRKK
jgi:catechol 2,3-dioxygenase-like lactoylglutathione lyase family enzyme